ncbi:hypothetical protein RCH06_003127 [Polaromonas sp. CG_9.5]|uniref:DUF4124 domain-containing protein n=1 Tax=Polaromonas sp. CG_9.5 TaxID=3071705 RepID=UPI002DFD5043|nr:hypothetical protein [Polaromonas sp. CG_9.5]
MRKIFFKMLVIAAVSGMAYGQSAPTYKCTTAGKVTYSDEPCVGGKVVDTTPTQGLDKISGTSKKGADVQKIEFNKAMAEGLKPLLGETPEQRAQRHKRWKLSDKEKLECWNLDGQIQETKTREPVSLYQARKRYKDLTC